MELCACLFRGCWRGLVLLGAKVRHNKELAQSEIAACESVLDMLRGLQRELGTDFSGQIGKAEFRYSVARGKLSEADEYPSFIEFSGCISIAVLAVGTFFCFMVSASDVYVLHFSRYLLLGRASNDWSVIRVILIDLWLNPDRV